MTSVQDLQHRVAEIPALLRATLDIAFGPDVLAPLGDPEIGLDVVGVGASELPARLLTQVLQRGGVRAQFLPVISMDGPPRDANKRALIVFSQGLSPNAELALGNASTYHHSILVTAVDPEGDSIRARVTRLAKQTILHPPPRETGTLVRIQGPLCSAVISLKIAAALLTLRQGSAPPWAGQLLDVPASYARSAVEQFDALGCDPAACIALGDETFLASGLMWKWQEALYRPLSVCTDVLSFAHGPLQSFYESRAMFLVLCPPGSEVVLSRLHESIVPERHRLLTIPATLPSPLSLFEYDAQLVQIILAEMRTRHIDPVNWPGKGADGPLYLIASRSDLKSHSP
jgi:hypothetical protein